MSDVEERAIRMGWVPQEEFKGDVDRWVNAETFVERGQEILPIMKERFGKLEENYTTLEGQNKEVTKKLAEVTDNLKKFAQFHKDTARRSYKRALKTLKDRQREAVEDRNTEEFDKIEKEIVDLDEQIKESAPVQPPDQAPPSDNNISPDFPAWHQKNPWYINDPELTAYANGVIPFIVEEHKSQGKTLTDAEAFNLVTEKVRETFPHKFANPNREAPPTVEGAGGEGAEGAGGGGKKKSWSDLPAEAKAAYNMHFSNIDGFEKSDYAKDYWEQEGA